MFLQRTSGLRRDINVPLEIMIIARRNNLDPVTVPRLVPLRLPFALRQVPQERASKVRYFFRTLVDQTAQSLSHPDG